MERQGFLHYDFSNKDWKNTPDEINIAGHSVIQKSGSPIERNDPHSSQDIQSIQRNISTGKGKFNFYGITIVTPTKKSYRIGNLISKGTFGTIYSASDIETNKLYAVKVIGNEASHLRSGISEVKILKMLKSVQDKLGSNVIIQLEDYFFFEEILFIVLEMAGPSLAVVLHDAKFQGLSLITVQKIVRQLLEAHLLHEKVNIIHCDFKPANILFSNTSLDQIRLIDYGSAIITEGATYPYIQSRWYRAPEVLLGNSYSNKIDIWSIGCIAAEIFLGVPLFSGSSELDQMKRITQTLGMPEASFVKKSPKASEFFTWDSGMCTFKSAGAEIPVRELLACAEHIESMGTNTEGISCSTKSR